MEVSTSNLLITARIKYTVLLAAVITVCVGHAGAARWNVYADGNWSDAANSSGGVPDRAGATASLTYDNVNGVAFSIASGAAIDLNFGSSVDFSKPFWNTNQAWTLVDNFDAVVGDGGSNSFSLGSTDIGVEGAVSVSRVAHFYAKNDVLLTWTAAVIPE